MTDEFLAPPPRLSDPVTALVFLDVDGVLNRLGPTGRESLPVVTMSDGRRFGLDLIDSAILDILDDEYLTP